MLRRIRHGLRFVAFGLGIVLLLWIPLSFVREIYIGSPWPGAYTIVRVQEAGISVSSREENTFIRFDSMQTRLFVPLQYRMNSARLALWPRFHRTAYPDGQGIVMQTDIQFPLWLLAAIFLAWPVSSFLLARRRRRERGFEVGPTPLPPGEVPRPQAEAERAGFRSHKSEVRGQSDSPLASTESSVSDV